MKVFFAALILVGLCVAGLGFNIFFRKNGSFPQTEIENNDEMKKLGIKCVKQEEMERARRKKAAAGTSCNGKEGCSGCEGCSFYNKK